MRRLLSLRIPFVAVAVIGAMMLGVLASCDDDSPPVMQNDAGKNDGIKQDAPRDWYVAPDTQRDQQIWPDVRPTPDTQPWPQPDGYVAGSFGCQADSDCFGQLCCPTPWGVKLCAPTCEL